MIITRDNLGELTWQKMSGLLPCIVQDVSSGDVLMQAYMSPESVEATLQSGRLTFFSRSKQRLWCKGESSGHYLTLIELVADCDRDAILAFARPHGPICHLGTKSCWVSSTRTTASVLPELEQTIARRKRDADPATSYTANLLSSGIQKCAQKVGEEGVEVALAAVAENDTALLNESADLLYHLLVTLAARGLTLDDVATVLRQRAGQ